MEISLSKRQMKMVDILLKESEYCTAATLANLLKVSEKTIHGEIAEINRKSKACMISSLKGKGYIGMSGSGRTISLVMRGEEI